MAERRLDIFPGKRSARLTAFYPDTVKEKLPAVIILPGGAYIFCADVEGAPVARAFADLGYCAFVLEYSALYDSAERVGVDEMNTDAVFPAQPEELAYAMAYVRDNAESFGTDGNRIVLCGLSAGGHLAAWYSAEERKNGEIAPAGQILCYPALDMREMHGEMGELMSYAVCGERTPGKETLEHISPLLNVHEGVPPTFMWHAAKDDIVSPQKTLDMAARLIENGVPCEMHLFPGRGHAVGAAEGMHCAQWIPLADRWMRRYIAGR